MNLVLDSPDRIVLRPALSVGFWDSLTNTLVDNGLEVTQRPRHETEFRIASRQNKCGLHIFHHLPGVSEEDRSVNGSPDVHRRFSFDVHDREQRYIPFTFEADCPSKGLFVPTCMLESPQTSQYIKLFSAATRNIPSGSAVVRADLRNSATNQPASWAMVSAEITGIELARGLADQEGRLALIFAYPEPLMLSPPAVISWRWPLILHVFYSPVEPTPAIPELCRVLEQAPAKFLITGLAPMEELELDLEYGRELVARSDAEVSYLSIKPA